MARVNHVMLEALESVHQAGRVNFAVSDYLERLIMAVREHAHGAPFREPTTPTYWY